MINNRVKKFLDGVVIFAIGILILLSDKIYITKLFGIFAIISIVYINERRKSEVKEKEDELRISAERYVMAIEAMNGAVWEWDEKTGKIYISDMMTSLLSIDNNYLKCEEWYKYVLDEDREKVKREIDNVCLNRLKVDLVLSYRVKDFEGAIKYLSYRGKGKIKGGVFYLTGVLNDVTEKRIKDIVMQDSFEKYKQVIEGSKDIVFCLNFKKGIINFDSKIKKYINVHSYDREIIVPYNEWLDIIHPGDKENYSRVINKVLVDSTSEFYEVEYRILTKDNKTTWINSKGKKVIVDNGEINIYGSLSDITKRKQSEMEIHFMSYYDDVTGMPNRRYFMDELQSAIARCSENSKLALVFIDLDNFKIINDTYGHYIGGLVLRSVCEKLYTVLEKENSLARFGGDEFVIIIENIKELYKVNLILDNIINEFKKPLKIDNKDIYCSFSVGISIYPDNATSINSLLKYADIAMYKAKENGKNRYEFFNESILNSVHRRFEIEKALRKAIGEGEIYLNFQPKVSLINDKIDGFEILVRWNSKELGFVPPNQFIPIAESSGMIIDIGKFIIEKSLKKCKELSLLTKERFHFAINISDVQLRDDNFVDYICKKLNEYDISPEYIEFEITESVIMKSVSKNIDTISKLKKLGITIALDDFGTGYSSLNYLRRLPIDVLKIDKSFIDGIGLDKKSDNIAKSIVELSHNLNLKVVAEGVENKEQFNYLNHINCDIIQGYYFSKPTEFDEIKDMLLI